MSTEAEVVAALAVQAAAPAVVEPGVVIAVPGQDGEIRLLDTDAFADAPRRAKAKRSVSDAESFVRYVNRHRTPGTEVYAHVLSSAVVAVIDAHHGTDEPAGWQDHRVELALEHSKEWLAWNARDLGQNPRGWFNQQEFAEFIEDRALDVHDPDHARLIEIATTFEAKSKADFNSAVRLDNGDVRFDYVEQTTAKAGEKGDIEIPKQLTLALRPYIGGPRVWVTAQFRYRLAGGGLMLGFALVRPEVILETAVDDIVTEIREGKTIRPENGDETVIHTGVGDVPIFYGKP
jgi:uncharacterized protein YfdQ (DUF2303 family)